MSLLPHSDLSCILKIVEKWLPETGAFSFAHEQGDPMSVQVVSEQPILTHADRCDRCGGRAYVLAIIVWSPTFRGDGQLYFCGHHYAKHAEALRPMTAVLIDERWQLTKHATDDGGPR